MSSARQYYQISSIDGVIIYIQQKICDPEDVKCQFRALDLATAEYMDIDYDSISHALIIKAFWTRSSVGDGMWHEKHDKTANDTIEVGVLINENPDEPEELRYSGWLTVIGQHKKPCEFLVCIFTCILDFLTAASSNSLLIPRQAPLSSSKLTYILLHFLQGSDRNASSLAVVAV